MKAESLTRKEILHPGRVAWSSAPIVLSVFTPLMDGNFPTSFATQPLPLSHSLKASSIFLAVEAHF